MVRDSRVEPSTVDADIVDSSMTRAGPSMLMLHIADGSMLQARTFHENAPHHGRFILQSGTIRAEARNRGRSHSSGSNPPR